ncbi:MAG: tryptophan halogenase family protein [Alphaproteobacteria bacterium]
MTERVRKIVIVGGGTSGWMAACYLTAVLATPKTDEQVSITLIESKDIGIIGVGEATPAHIKHILLAIGVDEGDFMRCCEATFKNAIRFDNFHAKGETFWHPFTQLTNANNYAIVNLWLAARRDGYRGSYAEAVAQDPAMCLRYLAPKKSGDAPYEGLVNYAYHIDTILLGRYLRDLSKRRGVRHVVDLVTGAGQDEAGNITHVSTEEHGDIAGDLFIDCTGFRALLLGKTLGEPFRSFNDVLFNDNAVAMRVPNPEGHRDIRPYTTCSAQDAGWIWNIPLYRRTGVGHVYSSAHMDKEAAERALRDYVGPAHEGLEANHIPMRIGRSERAWVKNVIAIGLSGGFIEPLESTGIYLTELGLTLLRDHFPTKSSMAPFARRYNRHMASYYDEIRDFITMHYCLTARTDTDYWRDCHAHGAIPPSLQEKLELWRNRPPTENDLDYTSELPAFSAISYNYVLAGMQRLPEHPLPAEAMQDLGFARAVLEDRRKGIADTVAQAPYHKDLLDQIHGGG